MGPEIAPVSEGAVAVLASKRLFAGVRPDVALEQPRPGERFAAGVTLAGQRVRPDVHLQGTQADVHLLAEFAREGLLRLALGGRAVELLVLRQAGVRRVRFVAVGARIPGGRRARGGVRAGARAALLHLRVHNRGPGGGATGGRPAALAAGRREVLRRHGRRGSQRAGTHGARR